MRLLSNSLVSGPKGGSLDFNIFPGVTAPEDKLEGLFVPIESLKKVSFRNVAYTGGDVTAPTSDVPAITFDVGLYHQRCIDEQGNYWVLVFRYVSSALYFDAYKLDRNTLTWSTICYNVANIAPASTTSSWEILCVHNNIMYFGGGYISASTQSDSTFYALNLSTLVRVTRAGLPGATLGLGKPCVIDNKIYFYGGFSYSSGVSYTHSAYRIYNITTNTWSSKSVSTAIIARPCQANALCSNIGGVVVSICNQGMAASTGSSTKGIAGHSLLYDPVTDTVTALPDISEVATGKIYIGTGAGLSNTNRSWPVQIGDKIFIKAANTDGADGGSGGGLLEIDLAQCTAAWVLKPIALDAATAWTIFGEGIAQLSFFATDTAVYTATKSGITVRKLALVPTEYEDKELVVTIKGAVNPVNLLNQEDLEVRYAVGPVYYSSAGVLSRMAGVKTRILGGAWTDL